MKWELYHLICNIYQFYMVFCQMNLSVGCWSISSHQISEIHLIYIKILIWCFKGAKTESFYSHLCIVKMYRLKSTDLILLYFPLLITGQSTVFVSVMLLAYIHYCDFTVWKPKHPQGKAECTTEYSRVDLSPVWVQTFYTAPVIRNHVINHRALKY